MELDIILGEAKQEIYRSKHIFYDKLKNNSIDIFIENFIIKYDIDDDSKKSLKEKILHHIINSDEQRNSINFIEQAENATLSSEEITKREINEKKIKQLPWPKFKKSQQYEVLKEFSDAYKNLLFQINHKPRGTRGDIKLFFKKRAMCKILSEYINSPFDEEVFPFVDKKEVQILYDNLKEEKSPIPTIKSSNVNQLNNMFRCKIKNGLNLGYHNLQDIEECLIKVFRELWSRPLDTFEWPYTEEDKKYWCEESKITEVINNNKMYINIPLDIFRDYYDDNKIQTNPEILNNNDEKLTPVDIDKFKHQQKTQKPVNIDKIKSNASQNPCKKKLSYRERPEYIKAMNKKKLKNNKHGEPTNIINNNTNSINNNNTPNTPKKHEHQPIQSMIHTKNQNEIYDMCSTETFNASDIKNNEINLTNSNNCNSRQITKSQRNNKHSLQKEDLISDTPLCLPKEETIDPVTYVQKIATEKTFLSTLKASKFCDKKDYQVHDNKNISTIVTCNNGLLEDDLITRDKNINSLEYIVSKMTPALTQIPHHSYNKHNKLNLMDEFVNNYCTIDTINKIKTYILYDKYVEWVKIIYTDKYILSITSMGKILSNRKFKNARGKTCNSWYLYFDEEKYVNDLLK